MMKKKVSIILLVLCAIGLGIAIDRVAYSFKNITKIPSSSSSMIAMYIQDEEGNYQLSNAQEFPKDGYALNTEKSSCKNGGIISQNSSTKSLSLKVKTSDECTVYFDVVTLKVGEGAKTLLAKMNDVSITDYNSGNKKEMFAFDHPEATQTTGWTDEERRDYRYIGNEPNNYITFNDETWRIIGVFTVETESGNKEQLVKIIRNESIGNISWDNSNGNQSPNEWSTASLQKLLNGDYYNQTGNYASSGSVKGLSEKAQAQIAKVKWYLGGSSTENLDGPNYYAFERGTETCVTTGKCNGKIRTTSILQNIGLMYPSDFIYTYAYGVDITCYSNGHNCNKGAPRAGWLLNNSLQWTLSPNADGAYSAFRLTNEGYVYYSDIDGVGDPFYGVRPTTFLSSEVAIVGGDGSQENPYVIG